MQQWYQPHPYGVLPRGNALGDASLAMRSRMGTLHLEGRTETEELEWMLELVAYLSPNDAARLSATCTCWYAFLHSTDFWKRLYTSLCPERLVFQCDWKTSVVRHWTSANGRGTARPQTAPLFVHRPLSCKERPLFNDTLFQSWMCTIMPPDYKLIKVGPLQSSTGDALSEEGITGCAAAAPGAHSDDDDGAAAGAAQSVPKTRGAGDAPPMRFAYKSRFKAIPKIDGSKCSPEVFQAKYEQGPSPVILTGIATQWPIYKILGGSFTRLSRPELFRHQNDQSATAMRCEHTAMTVEEYLAYALHQRDERPIYMFDAEFGDALRADALFAVPPMFAVDDYFSVLHSARPKYRWLIAGPARGGSSFHVDPNMTHAWNACLTGRKRWLLFPPNKPPPGVYPSADMSDVTTPVSLTEWLMNFYDASLTSLRCEGYEGICEAGEVMYVPAGWWHFVINLEDSVALTQNYVSRTNLPKVIQFLRTMKSSISGVNEDADGANMQSIATRRDGFADEFVHAMRANHPAITRTAEEQIEDAAAARRKRPREAKVEMLDDSSEGFSFAF